MNEDCPSRLVLTRSAYQNAGSRKQRLLQVYFSIQHILLNNILGAKDKVLSKTDMILFLTELKVQ